MVILMLLTKTLLLDDKKVCLASYMIHYVISVMVTVQSPHQDLLQTFV